MKLFRSLVALLAFSVLALASARAEVELISGFNFGQFIGGGYPSTDGLNGLAVGFVRSNFARNVAPTAVDSGAYHVANGIEAPFASGVATLYFDGTHGSGAWDFSGGADVSVEERGSLVAINHNLVNGAQMFIGDDNNAALVFAAGAVTDFAIVTDTTGWSDFSPAAFNQPNDFNFTFSAYARPGAAASIQWLFDGVPVGSPIAVAPGEFQAFNLDLPSAFYGRADATLIGRVTGQLVIDHVQINGVAATPAVFTQQPQSQSVTAGADVSFTVAVSSAASPTYRWRRNGVSLTDGPDVSGSTGATLTLTGVTTALAGSYTVVVNNNGATSESEPAILTVNTLPAVTEPPSSASANPGETIVFEVEASGSPAPSYRWRKDGVDLADDVRISGATTAVLSISGLLAEDEGLYTVVVANIAGSVESAAATLTITDDSIAPSIQQQPGSTSVVLGNVATFRVNASGAPAPAYRWKKNGEPLADGAGIVGAATATLRITAADASAAGSYTVAVSNSAGAVESDPAALTVLFPPSLPSGSGPVGVTLNVGGGATLSASPDGTPPFTYQWKKNGQELAGETGAELVLSSVDLSAAGDYTVVITNAAGSQESGVATVVVIVPPAIVTPPAAQTVGLGATATFSVVATGTAELSYRWKRDGEDIPGADAATFVVHDAQLSDAGDYSVVVSNTGGSVESSVARLEIAVRIDRATGAQKLPPGTRLLLDSGFASGAGYRFQWLRNGKPVAGAAESTLLIDSADFGDSGSYSVRVFSASGRFLVSRSVAKLSVTVAGTYDALLRDPIAGAPVGRLTLTVGSTGAFTGRLLDESGRSHALRGRFAFADEPHLGEALVTLPRPGGLAALEIDLTLDSRETRLEVGLGEAGAEGMIGAATARSRLAASAIAPWNGAYSLALVPVPVETADELPATSTLSSTVTRKGGAMKITGRLADGTRVTSAASPSQEGAYAHWLPLYSAKGCLGGGLVLVEGTDGSYSAGSDASGPWLWRRPPNPKSTTYPDGIDLLLAPDLDKR